jgi:ribosomal protein S2
VLNLTQRQLFICNAYLGYSKKNWNKEMSLFVLGLRYNVCFLKLNYIYYLLKKIFILLNNINLNGQTIFMVVPNIFKTYIFSNILYNLKFLKKSINIVVINKWIYGTLTNFNNINYIKKNILFGSIREFPNVFIIIDNNHLNIIYETYKFNIITLGILDTKDSPYSYNYMFSGNTSSFEVLVFFFKLLFNYLYFLHIKNISNFLKLFFKKYKLSGKLKKKTKTFFFRELLLKKKIIKSKLTVSSLFLRKKLIFKNKIILKNEIIFLGRLRIKN